MIEKEELPSGWAWATLGELCEINPKHAGDCPDTLPVSFVPMAAVDEQSGEISGAVDRPYGEIRKGYTHFADGDVLWAKITPCMENGKSAVARGLTNGIGCGTTEFFVLRSRGAVLPNFLLYFMRRASYRTAARKTMQSGVGQARVPKEFIESTIMPVPPLAEQRRIVAKLDELLASSRAAWAALDAVPANVSSFVRSVVSAAFDGRLTADVRETGNAEASFDLTEALQARESIWSTLLQDEVRLRRYERKTRGCRAPESVQPDLTNGVPDVPRGWTTASVGQLALCLDSFRVPVKREDRGLTGGYAYFGANGRVGEISDYIFDLDMVLVTEDETFYGRTKPIAYRVSGKCWVNNHAHVLLPVAPFTPEFLHYALMYYDVEPWLSGTTGRAKLTQFDLLRLPILVPPAEEREELCRRVRLGLEAAQRMREHTENLSQRMRALEEACVAKALRGELVSQDPSDEPAATLLAGVLAGRTAPLSSRTRRRRPASA